MQGLLLTESWHRCQGTELSAHNIPKCQERCDTQRPKGYRPHQPPCKIKATFKSSNTQRSILVSLFGIVNVRNFLRKNCGRGVCNQAISTKEGEKPTNQKKKNLYRRFQIQLTDFTGKNSFSPQPLHKEGVVGGQQRRTKQELSSSIYTTPEPWHTADRSLPQHAVPAAGALPNRVTSPVAQHPGD